MDIIKEINANNQLTPDKTTFAGVKIVAPVESAENGIDAEKMAREKNKIVEITNQAIVTLYSSFLLKPMKRHAKPTNIRKMLVKAMANDMLNYWMQNFKSLAV